MKMISLENALSKLIEIEKNNLETLSKEELINRCLRAEDNLLDQLSYDQVSNRLSILTNGEFAVIRTDLGVS
jgi:hypothetical protein